MTAGLSFPSRIFVGSCWGPWCWAVLLSLAVAYAAADGVGKHVAQAQGGRVEVRSRVGEGSEFSLILPVLPGLKG
jgi:hypothetical protein